ncbi:MAG: TRAP transporter small permease [Rhodobacterales bacterium]|nr:TRAP transporter small permease [Rhodobacterales bacterium]
MLRALNRGLEWLLTRLLTTCFGALIAVVFIQVFARNVLVLPQIWTLDVAQLLFAWCIFIGAAVALRWDAHYTLDLFPDHWTAPRALFRVIGHVGSVIVVWVLIAPGWTFAQIGLNRFAPAIGISEFWFFLPIPLGGLAMALFLAEMIPDDLRALRAALAAPDGAAEGTE